MKKSDRRIQKTRKHLQNALVSLILEKGYQKITVQEIIDRADVGRSTFYGHFSDKEDLLTSGFSDLAQDLNQHVGDAHHPIENPDHLLHSLDFFRHAAQNRPLYEAMMESGGGDLILEIGRRHMQKEIEQHLAALVPDDRQVATPIPVLTHYLAGALNALVTWWLKSGSSHTPEMMDEMFNALAMPGVWKVLGKGVSQR